VRQHDFDLDSENTLSEKDVPDSSIDIFLGGVAAVDHQPIHKLHGFSSLAAQFTGYDDLATFSTGLHNESEDTVTGASDGKTTDQFVPERFSLSDGAKTTSRHLLGIQFDGTIGIVEALLNDGGQFTNTLTFVAQHVLRTRREDDNLRARGRHAHLQCDRGDDSDGDRGMAGRREKSREERSLLRCNHLRPTPSSETHSIRL